MRRSGEPARVDACQGGLLWVALYECTLTVVSHVGEPLRLLRVAGTGKNSGQTHIDQSATVPAQAEMSPRARIYSLCSVVHTSGVQWGLQFSRGHK